MWYAYVWRWRTGSEEWKSTVESKGWIAVVGVNNKLSYR